MLVCVFESTFFVCRLGTMALGNHGPKSHKTLLTFLHNNSQLNLFHLIMAKCEHASWVELWQGEAGPLLSHGWRLPQMNSTRHLSISAQPSSYGKKNSCPPRGQILAAAIGYNIYNIGEVVR